MAYNMEKWELQKGFKSKPKTWMIKTNQVIVNYLIGCMMGILATLIYLKL